MQYSGNKVIVQELIEGCKLDDLDGLREIQADLGLIAERLIQSFFQQVFSEGVFHGDPHPGNLRILPNNVLVFLDQTTLEKSQFSPAPTKSQYHNNTHFIGTLLYTILRLLHSFKHNVL